MNLKLPPQPPPATAPGRGWLWLAFAWGLAESTFFFLVPDVLSSRLVLQRSRTGFAACGYSLAGALVGGSTLYFLGRDPAVQRSILFWADFVPGIHPALIDQARLQLVAHGPAALFSGFISGIPYKLYAAQAAGAGIGPGTFLLASATARLTRFLLVTTLTWSIGAFFLPTLGVAAKLRLHAAGWVSFYLFYFLRMGI